MEGGGQGGLQAQVIPGSISLFLLALPVTLQVSLSLSICRFLEASGPQRPRFKSSRNGTLPLLSHKSRHFLSLGQAESPPGQSLWPGQ